MSKLFEGGPIMVLRDGKWYWETPGDGRRRLVKPQPIFRPKEQPKQKRGSK